MSKARILVVEDEEDILKLIKYNLEKEGYRVAGVASGEKALMEAKESLPDLVLLDLMLPGVDGLDVCKLLKSDPKTRDVSIVMLTAKGDESDIVTGLELGADDYIVKPFSPGVLIARIKAVLRQKEKQAVSGDTVVKIHDIMIDPGRHEALVGGKPVELTLSEFRILHLLAQRPGWVFTRTRIVDAVHGDDYPVTERSVDVQMVGLRKKLGRAGKHIETVRGVGYRLKE